MPPVLPLDVPPVEQAHVRLLHELGRLPPPVTPLGREDPARHLAEFVLNQRRERGQAVAVSATPRLKEASAIGHCRHNGEFTHSRYETSSGVEYGTATALFGAAIQAGYFNDSHRWQVAPDGQRFLLLPQDARQQASPLDVHVNWPALLRK